MVGLRDRELSVLLLFLFVVNCCSQQQLFITLVLLMLLVLPTIHWVEAYIRKTKKKTRLTAEATIFSMLLLLFIVETDNGQQQSAIHK